MNVRTNYLCQGSEQVLTKASCSSSTILVVITTTYILISYYDRINLGVIRMFTQEFSKLKKIPSTAINVNYKV